MAKSTTSTAATSAAASGEAATGRQVTVQEHYERSHYEATLDVRFHARLHLIHARLFRRVRGILSFATLFSGSAAFAMAVADKPPLMKLAALAVAIITIVEHVLDPARKAAHHDHLRARYVLLDRDAPRLKLDELDKRLGEIGVDDGSIIDALRGPAMNDVLRQNGREDWTRRLGRWERIMGWFA